MGIATVEDTSQQLQSHVDLLSVQVHSVTEKSTIVQNMSWPIPGLIHLLGDREMGTFISYTECSEETGVPGDRLQT